MSMPGHAIPQWYQCHPNAIPMQMQCRTAFHFKWGRRLRGIPGGVGGDAQGKNTFISIPRFNP